MTLPLTPQPNCPMETPTAAKTMSTQLLGVINITLTGMVDTMVPNSGPWSLLGQSVSYIIKLGPILCWTLPSGPAVFQPKPTNASNYAWLSDKYITTCLHSTCQEIIVPELPTIETWEEMKQLLINKFGSNISLEVKKDAFMHIAFKSKETLAKFADRFYMERQQLIMSRQLTSHEAYMACAQALKVNQLLCLHFKAHKAMLSSIKSIKTLLQDMHLTHS
ncbi:hypothetical protein DSO57_1020039 [Entomophthora muscae]|uniref:Uncharacterized protein n=1 Tax=Entomophthora muscae TaxID=34485 RepID=A0ACC2S5Z1_9FUNG|nr:hypothetical protein DSO57_1020039 [Entomophthora muscae]